MRFWEQFHGMRQVPAFRKRSEENLNRDGAIFVPQIREDLCLAGIFSFVARPNDEVVFHIRDMSARSIGLLESNRHRAVAKVRSPQAELTIVVPDSGFVSVDLTNRGIDDPNESWIKCSHITCAGRTLLRARKAPPVSPSAPKLRLEYPSPA